METRPPKFQMSAILLLLFIGLSVAESPLEIEVVRKLWAWDCNHFEGIYEMLDPWFLINGEPIYIKVS